MLGNMRRNYCLLNLCKHRKQRLKRWGLLKMLLKNDNNVISVTDRCTVDVLSTSVCSSKARIGPFLTVFCNLLNGLCLSRANRYWQNREMFALHAVQQRHSVQWHLAREQRMNKWLMSVWQINNAELEITLKADSDRIKSSLHKNKFCPN